jgi:hypothetical protein
VGGGAGMPPTDPVKQVCIDTYASCIDNNWEGPCGVCLMKCVVQREWDSTLCHPRVKCPK